jgi:hypothetical protein
MVDSFKIVMPLVRRARFFGCRGALVIRKSYGPVHNKPTQLEHESDSRAGYRPGAISAVVIASSGIPFNAATSGLAGHPRHHLAAMADTDLCPRPFPTSTCGLRGQCDPQDTDYVLDTEAPTECRVGRAEHPGACSSSGNARSASHRDRAIVSWQRRRRIPPNVISVRPDQHRKQWHRPSRGYMLNLLFKLAVISGAEAAVRFHLRRGDDINARDTDGRSPLLLAALNGHARLCCLLLAEGADPLLPDNEGNCALYIAKINGSADIVREIERHLHQLNGSLDAPTTKPVIDVVDTTEWEEDIAPPVPRNDDNIIARATALNEDLSRHVPIDTSEDWSDVDLILPIISTGRLWSNLDDAVKTQLRRFLQAGILHSHVSRRYMDAVIPPDEGSEPDREFEHRLYVTLGDLDVFIDDGVYAERLHVDIDDAQAPRRVRKLKRHHSLDQPGVTPLREARGMPILRRKLRGRALPGRCGSRSRRTNPGTAYASTASSPTVSVLADLNPPDQAASR